MTVCRLVRFLSLFLVFGLCFLLPLTGCQDPGESSADTDLSLSGPDGPSGIPDSSPDAYSLIEPETPLIVELGDGLSLHFPSGWSEQIASGSLSEWANREQTVFLSAEPVPLDSPEGLTGEIILDGIREDVELSYPPSDGYTVRTETLSLSFGETTSLTVSKAGGPFRQQIGLIRGQTVYILTVTAPSRAEALSVWTFVTVS
ncbi:MAG: hypothetical protein J5843_04595 [Clostridia bacterium]|nr:hypothetical protein [Clostridia bacterium]